MRRSTRIATITSTAALLLLAGACEDDPAEEEAADAEDAEDVEDVDDDEDVPEDGEEVTLGFAHVYELTAPTHECGADLLPERLEEADVGLNVEVYPASQLGSEAEIVEQVAAGELEMAIAGPSFLGTWHEPVGVFDAAYAFEDEEHLMEVAEGELGQELWDALREERGIRVLGTWYYGARHITSNEPVHGPEDLEGVRLRMPDAEVWLESGAALGASPTAVAFDEVYVSLQQGVIDAQENPIPTIDAMGFHEVQDHLNLTGHIQSSTQNLIAEDTWESLSEDQQDALVDALDELADEVSACIADGDERLVEEWRDSGELEINEDIDVDAFSDQAYEHFADGFAYSDLYVQIVERDY